MSSARQNTIIASVVITTLFLLMKKKAAFAAEVPKVGVGLDDIDRDRDIDARAMLLDQKEAIYIKVPGYQVYSPQRITGTATIEQQDDDIILKQF